VLENLAFASVEHLAGGTGPDAFVFEFDGRLRGGVDGGAGGDSMDSSDWSDAVTVDLAAGSALLRQPTAGLQRVTASRGFNQMEGKSVTAFCPGGKRATGLGATSSLEHRGVIDDLQPNDAPTTTGTPPPTSGKATGHVNENADMLDWWIASHVICADASFTLQPA
jgi:hypothetical protein